MKKSLLFSLFFISCLQLVMGKNEEHHVSSKESSITIGTGVEYSNELNHLGYNIRAYYNIGEHICFGPEFSYFKKDEVEILDANLIAHYIFEVPFGGLYPLLGANYTKEIEDLETHKESDTAYGVVFGGGFHKSFKKKTVFIEYARVESGLTDSFGTL